MNLQEAVAEIERHHNGFEKELKTLVAHIQKTGFDEKDLAMVLLRETTNALKRCLTGCPNNPSDADCFRQLDYAKQELIDSDQM